MRFLYLGLLLKLAHAFSDDELAHELYTCTILREVCEWRDDWIAAEGIRRELYAGKPKTQFYYFCSESRNETCGYWVDQNGVKVEDASRNDTLIGDVFVFNDLSVHTTGEYYRLPETEDTRRFIIE